MATASGTCAARSPTSAARSSLGNAKPVAVSSGENATQTICSSRTDEEARPVNPAGLLDSHQVGDYRVPVLNLQVVVASVCVPAFTFATVTRYQVDAFSRATVGLNVPTWVVVLNVAAPPTLAPTATGAVPAALSRVILTLVVFQPVRFPEKVAVADRSRRTLVALIAGARAVSVTVAGGGGVVPVLAETVAAAEVLPAASTALTV